MSKETPKAPAAPQSATQNPDLERATDTLNLLRRRLADTSRWAEAGIDAFFPMLEASVHGLRGASTDSRPSHADSLAAVERGFASVAVEDEFKRVALSNIGQWLEEQAFAEYRDQLLWMIETQKWDLLLDSFYRVLPFGTGGSLRDQ